MGLPRPVRHLQVSGERSPRSRPGSGRMKSKLARVFDELLREIETNLDLRARIERHLGVPATGAQSGTVSSRRRNKRSAAAVDPYAEFKQGEHVLRQKLSSLSVEQLK